MVGIIISLIGTFAALWLAGFSINLLTLFALVLAIGTVVDDAIIVVEAIQAKLDQGYKSAYQATVDGMKGITSPIIVSTMIFMAVFIPVTFMGGTSGTFFTQFGVTMAVAVGISAVNALTLSPALCALLIRPEKDSGEGGKSFQQRFRKGFNTAFHTITNRYAGGVKFLLKRKWLAGGILAVAIALLVLAMTNTKTGLVPDEDQGMLFVNVNTAPGTTLSQTQEVMTKVEEVIKTIPQVAEYSNNAGFGMLSGQTPTTGMIMVRLKDWSERKGKNDDINSVINEIYARTANIKNAQIFVMAPPMIIGYGAGDGFELYTQDRAGNSVEDLYYATQDFVAKLNERPEIGMAYFTFDIKYPQYSVEVDFTKCKRQGISPNEVLSTISSYYGGVYSSDINRFSKVYRVMMQASPEYRLDKESLNNIFVKTNEGMAPVGQFVTLTKTYGSENISRFNMFNSIAINGSLADGYSSGDAITAIKEIAQQYLPTGYGYEFGGMSREESGSSNNTIIVIALCMLFIFLILSALYESFLIPFAVILSVPIGLMGSFLFTWIFGLENNIYLQTGVIMLIGLLSKTAILITELAQRYRKEGLSIFDSALRAAKERLRPILMTALTMIVGLLPLVFASGAGANGNISLGVGTVFGMTIGTLALLFITPTLFAVMQYLQEKVPSKLKMEIKK
jgi:HAE1 family hydrophobic/amphiphilic exporter-1